MEHLWAVLASIHLSLVSIVCNQFPFLMAEANIFFCLPRLIVASESIKKVDKWISRVYVVVCRLSGSLLHRPRNISVSPVACIDDKLFTGGGEKQLGKKQRGCNLRKAFTYFFVTPSDFDYDYTKMKGILLLSVINTIMWIKECFVVWQNFLLCCAELQKYNAIVFHIQIN